MIAIVPGDYENDKANTQLHIDSVCNRIFPRSCDNLVPARTLQDPARNWPGTSTWVPFCSSQETTSLTERTPLRRETMETTSLTERTPLRRETTSLTERTPLRRVEMETTSLTERTPLRRVEMERSSAVGLKDEETRYTSRYERKHNVEVPPREQETYMDEDETAVSTSSWATEVMVPDEAHRMSKSRPNIQSSQQSLSGSRHVQEQGVRSAIQQSGQTAGVEQTQKIKQLTDSNERLQQQVAQLQREKAGIQGQLQNAEERVTQKDHELGRINRRCQNAEEALQEKDQRLNDYLIVLDIQPYELQLKGKQLGSGSFGAVQVGCWCGVPVAVKTFHEALRLPEFAPIFMKELSICSQLHHPNIVPICGAVMEDGIPIQLVMELLQGSLSDLMKAARSSSLYMRYLSFREQIDIAADTVTGIMYMHGRRPEPYVHCDIRSTNVMITRDMMGKVGDLGASHVISSTTSLGALSPQYVAPEKFPRADGTSARSTIKSDVYSLGVTLTELFTGLAPIRKERRSQVHRISNDHLMDMCIQMTSDKSATRPSAQDCFDVLKGQKATNAYKMLPGRRTVLGNLEGVDMKILDFGHV